LALTQLNTSQEKSGPTRRELRAEQNFRFIMKRSKRVTLEEKDATFFRQVYKKNLSYMQCFGSGMRIRVDFFVGWIRIRIGIRIQEGKGNA
jgi:hypothetical protein